MYYLNLKNTNIIYRMEYTLISQLHEPLFSMNQGNSSDSCKNQGASCTIDNISSTGLIDVPLNPENSNIKNITNNLKWANKEDRGYYFQSSIEKFGDLVKKYGQCNNIIYDIGGFAQWYKKEFYELIEVHDRILINDWPQKHNSIITLYVHINIKREYWNKIQDITSDILYDFISNNLIIRCPTISFGNALLAIILEYINDEQTWSKLSTSPIIINRLKKQRLTDTKYQDKDLQLIKKYLKEN